MEKKSFWKRFIDFFKKLFGNEAEQDKMDSATEQILQESVSKAEEGVERVSPFLSKEIPTAETVAAEKQAGTVEKQAAPVERRAPALTEEDFDRANFEEARANGDSVGNTEKGIEDK